MPVRIVDDDRRDSMAVGKETSVQPGAHDQIVARIDVKKVLIKRGKQHRDLPPAQQLQKMKVFRFVMSDDFDLIILCQVEQ